MSERRVVRTVCPHDCPDQCSILATIEGDRLLQVAGDPEHSFTAGFLCGKVSQYEERVHSPERLLTPLRRTGAKGAGEFTPITWDAALDEIAQRWQGIVAQYGREALLGYSYSGHMGLISRNIMRALMHALGASSMLTGTVCDSIAEAGWEYACGPTPGTDPETVVQSDLILCWGANLATTNVHMLPFVERARKSGGQLIVIDPMRSRTARMADWHIAPRLGTDGALALGVMHVLVREGLADEAYLAKHGMGWAQVRDAVLPAYTPAMVASLTGVAAADVERLALLYGRARAPFLRLGIALSRHSQGGMAIRNIALLPAVVGAWGKPGAGALMETALIWGFDYDAIRRPDLAPRPTRQINQAQLGRALQETTAPPIMALLVTSSNPAVSSPDSNRVAAGLSRPDLFTVVHDTFLSDTARYADLVLPACTSFETEDLFRSYGTYYAQYTPALLSPQGESRSSLWLVQALAQRLGLPDPFFHRSPREHMAALLSGASGPTADLRLDDLLAGVPLKLSYPQTGPEQVFFHSAAMAAAGLPPLPEYTPGAVAPNERWPLRLLSVPGHFQHHTAFATSERLQRQAGAPNCLLHPDEAAARGIADGDPVLLHNDRGEVGLFARVSAAAPPGVVVVEGQRNRARFLRGGPLNALVADDLSELGEGAIYQDTWLQASRL